jgi:hypothetical protein
MQIKVEVSTTVLKGSRIQKCKNDHQPQLSIQQLIVMQLIPKTTTPWQPATRLIHEA